jgi:hypothetical protein
MATAKEKEQGKKEAAAGFLKYRSIGYKTPEERNRHKSFKKYKNLGYKAKMSYKPSKKRGGKTSLDRAREKLDRGEAVG